MADEKKPLQNDEMVEAAGGARVEPAYIPYNDEYFPVSCPKCGGHNILWHQGFTFTRIADQYKCVSCGLYFCYSDLTDFGGSNDW